MSKAEEEAQGRKGAARGRSPSYPGIDLGTAIERAETLYGQERQNLAHLDTILRHWGYMSPRSGGGLVTFAALKKFGLVTEEGSGGTRRGRLSELALRIIQDQRPNSMERQEAIREAALRPPIHRELWEQYEGALPSDENLRFTLLQDRHFTERGADEFIQEFRATIAFSRLGESDTMSPTERDRHETSRGGSIGAGAGLLDRPKDPTLQSIPLPVAPGEYAVLQGAFPLTEQKWEQMLAVLTAMKPALVASDLP